MKEKEQVAYWQEIYKRMAGGKKDIWDYQWTISIWNHGGVAISPNTNLIQNIGFGEEATHTSNIKKMMKNSQFIDIGEIVHPNEMLVDAKADKVTFENHFRDKVNFLNQVRNLAYRFLPSSLITKWRFVKSKFGLS